MQRYLPFIALLLLSGCQQSSSPVVCPPQATAPCPSADAAPPPPSPDAAPTPNDACAAGEQNLLKLGCKDSRGKVIGSNNLHGESWAQVCRDDAAHGVDMKPACMAAAKNCTEVESCR